MFKTQTMNAESRDLTRDLSSRHSSMHIFIFMGQGIIATDFVENALNILRWIPAQNKKFAQLHSMLESIFPKQPMFLLVSDKDEIMNKSKQELNTGFVWFTNVHCWQTNSTDWTKYKHYPAISDKNQLAFYLDQYRTLLARQDSCQTDKDPI